MALRRGLVALTVVSALLLGVSPVFAQVDEAERRARDAAVGVDEAYVVVSSAVADAEAVETALLAALDEYRVAASELATAGVELQRISDALAFADARAVAAEQQLSSHTVTAYMEAVTNTASIVFDTDSAEEAMVVGQVVRESQANALGTLGDLLTQRSELERIRAEHAIELVHVETSEQQLARRTEELHDLFVAANAEVAAAFELAAEADRAHRAALDGVERAVAEDEAARRAVEAATTTTLAPITGPATTSATTAPATTSAPATAPGPTTTTSTSAAAESDWPPIPLSDRTLALRPLVERHFAGDLVLDALIVIQCESLGDPDALNPYSGAAGLFQFLPGTWAVASVGAGVGDQSVFAAEANVAAAAWLSEYYRSRTGDPWRPWSCRSHL